MIVVPRVLISWVKSVGIHDKKRDRYEQEIAINIDLIYRVRLGELIYSLFELIFSHKHF